MPDVSQAIWRDVTVDASLYTGDLGPAAKCRLTFPDGDTVWLSTHDPEPFERIGAALAQVAQDLRTAQAREVAS